MVIDTVGKIFRAPRGYLSYPWKIPAGIPVAPGYPPNIGPDVESAVCGISVVDSTIPWLMYDTCIDGYQ